jgi:type IV secretory pathway VirB4 component
MSRSSTNLGTSPPPRKQFGIKQADRLFHTYLIGQTGTGKSTLIRNMATQDIEQGRGFCLINPHGDLARSVAEMAGDGCHYWDAADPNYSYGNNPLTTDTPSLVGYETQHHARQRSAKLDEIQCGEKR